MKENIQIKAVDMVRRIRDKHAQILAGKSKSELIDFFNKAGKSSIKFPESKPEIRSNQNQIANS